MNYNSIIVRFGEMSTKGHNKKDFIFSLARSIRENLKPFEEKYSMVIRHDHIYIYLKENNIDFTKELKEIPGMYSFSLCLKVADNTELDHIKEVVLKEIKGETGKTFKMATRRIDKSYPYTSDDINREIAGYILANTNLVVDVHNPDILFSIEVHSDGFYLFTKTIKGMGGYPKGSIGRGLMMISGGIDSPVASFMLMKRGVELSFIHFAAHPYTNSAVIQKLVDLLAVLNEYQTKIRLYIVPFTKLQEEIYKYSDVGYPITIMRRMMYRIAVEVAKEKHIPVICSGESIGQVASQTLESMNVINSVTNMPVIRPLATFDKVDIIKIAKEIGTYDISIRPFEDCCTIFAPVKPKTAPHEDICEAIEKKFDYQTLVDECVKNIEIKEIKREI